MLTELLDTRVMVKQAMKSVKGDKVRTQVLSACLSASHFPWTYHSRGRH